MRTNYKEEIKATLQANGMQANYFTSLPDNKSVNTTGAYKIGFCGTVSAKSWKAVYTRVVKAIQAEKEQAK